jgi:hypothetical protein
MIDCKEMCLARYGPLPKKKKKKKKINEYEIYFILGRCCIVQKLKVFVFSPFGGLRKLFQCPSGIALIPLII